MKTFIQWAGEEKKELPLFEPVKENSTKRAGIAYWAYPDSYVRSAYPDLYFAPTAADHMEKMGKHQPSRKAPPDNAP